MEKHALVDTVDSVHAEWFALIDQLGTEGLERESVVGEWRVRDVVAHANCWDRWQLVQLRCAFTGETPSDDELHGEVRFPPNDDMSEDAMNAMFLAGYADVATGDRWLGGILEEIEASPLWPRLAVIVTYDENGGFWDHAPPPVVDEWGPGSRIPAVIISPWARPGYVDSTPYDTTSILRFIAWRWNLPPLASRDANANNLLAAFDFAQLPAGPAAR